jgi:hypothetical protein
MHWNDLLEEIEESAREAVQSARDTAEYESAGGDILSAYEQAWQEAVAAVRREDRAGAQAALLRAKGLAAGVGWRTADEDAALKRLED